MKEIENIKKIFSDLENGNNFSLEERYEFLKHFLPKHSDIFSSQEGEDILIKRLLKKIYNKKGFYVDIGAYDPVRFSNTFHFYLKGWNGINIDPNKKSIELFNKLRPRDINLNIGIGDNQETLEYFEFEEGAFNTFSKEQAENIKNSNKTKFLASCSVGLDSIKNILDKYLVDEQDITFMNIDVEGFELEVINSNDWNKYRPFIVCIEALDKDIEKLIDSSMFEKNYTRVAKTKNTIFYVEKDIYVKLEKDEEIELKSFASNKIDNINIYQIINDDLNKIQLKFKQNQELLEEKKDEIKNIYASKKYKLVRILTKPYIFIRNIFKNKIKVVDSNKFCISVIIPNYNNSKYIEDCLDSVIAQTHKNIEIVVVDDCSTDNSRDILNQYAEKYTFIKLIFNETNQGVGRNRDIGIRASKGNFITTLDSDDYYIDENKLKKELDLILKYKNEKNQDVIAFSNIVLVNADKSKIGYQMNKKIVQGDVFEAIFSRDCMIPRDFLFTKNIYQEIGGFDFDIPIYEDWDLKIRLASKYHFYHVDVDGIGYRKHGQGLSSARQEEHHKWKKYITLKNFYLIEDKKNRLEFENKVNRFLQ